MFSQWFSSAQFATSPPCSRWKLQFYGAVQSEPPCLELPVGAGLAHGGFPAAAQRLAIFDWVRCGEVKDPGPFHRILAIEDLMGNPEAQTNQPEKPRVLESSTGKPQPWHPRKNVAKVFTRIQPYPSLSLSLFFLSCSTLLKLSGLPKGRLRPGPPHHAAIKLRDRRCEGRAPIDFGRLWPGSQQLLTPGGLSRGWGTKHP